MTAARAVGVVLLGAAVATVMSLLRFDAVNIALGVAAATVLGTVVGHRELGHDLAWPALPTTESGGLRHEVSQLSWTLTSRDGHVSPQGLRRLREVAASRLRLAGLDPEDDAAVRAALGEPAWRVLRADTADPATVRALSACLTALEQLPGANHEP